MTFLISTDIAKLQNIVQIIPSQATDEPMSLQFSPRLIFLLICQSLRQIVPSYNFRGICIWLMIIFFVHFSDALFPVFFLLVNLNVYSDRLSLLIKTKFPSCFYLLKSVLLGIWPHRFTMGYFL